MNPATRRGSRPRMMLRPALGSLPLAGAMLLIGTGITALAGQGMTGGSSHDPLAVTMAQVRSEGHQAYSERPADVQVVMQRMYGNDSHYHRLSALFVDHAPGDRPGSLQIDIQEPDLVHTAAYGDDEGAGPAQEILVGQGDYAHLYSPAANAYTTIGRPVPAPYPPLASVPLGFLQRIDSRATIIGSRFSGAKTGLAEMYVHPSVLITGAFFTNKDVTIVGRPTLAGRSTWELRGHQVPKAPVLRTLGDGWRMWVDAQTGIVLRLEYYTGSSLIGWAEMRNVVIDGNGQGASGTTAAALSWLRAWSLPTDARELDYGAYNDLAPAK